MGSFLSSVFLGTITCCWWNDFVGEWERRSNDFAASILASVSGYQNLGVFNNVSLYSVLRNIFAIKVKRLWIPNSTFWYANINRVSFLVLVKIIHFLYMSGLCTVVSTQSNSVVFLYWWSSFWGWWNLVWYLFSRRNEIRMICRQRMFVDLTVLPDYYYRVRDNNCFCR